MIVDQLWKEGAACRGANTDWFFPSTKSEESAAKGICRTCPMREPCLEYALTLPADQRGHGIWGGTNDTERKAIARSRRLRHAT